MSRGYGGQFEEFFEPQFRDLSWSLDLKDLRDLRISQRRIRRYDVLLKRARTLSLKAVASLERLQRVMRRGETVRDILRRRTVSTR